jgi:hypothetical protein
LLSNLERRAIHFKVFEKVTKHKIRPYILHLIPNFILILLKKIQAGALDRLAECADTEKKMT